jgi:hypothetical protein
MGPNDYDPDYYENLPSTLNDFSTFTGLMNDWCSLGSVIPTVSAPGGIPTHLTTQQKTVYDNQRKQENRYTFSDLKPLDTLEQMF